jgi:putative transcriptional regulator
MPFPITLSTESSVAMAKNRLKVLRAMRDLTQEAMAEKVGVSRQTVIAIESNKYNPSLDLAFKLARFFGVAIEEIFFYEEERAAGDKE